MPHILPAFASLVVAYPGSLDCSDVAATNIVAELGTRTRWVFRSSICAASALPDVTEQRLALLSKTSIPRSKPKPMSTMTLLLNQMSRFATVNSQQVSRIQFPFQFMI